jgi:uncharacterized protein YbjT (DUF2867 family)
VPLPDPAANHQPPTILVAGATGNQGGAVIDALARDPQRFHIGALTRNPQDRKARALSARGIEVFAGDMADAGTLKAALAGAHGVFSVQNSMTAGLNKEILQGVILADAAQAAGVKHLVYTSAGGADRESGVPHFETKWRIEQHLRAIGLPATILRPVSFMEGFGAPGIQRAVGLGIFGSAVPPGKSLQMIAVPDIGIFARLAWENPGRYIGAELELAGDELTIAQIPATIWRATGKRIVPRIPIPATLTRRMGDPGKMITWIADDGYHANISALRALHPGLLRFEDWLRQHND